MKTNVHGMTKGKTLKTWVQEWVVEDSTHSAEEGSSSPSTLKEAFLAEVVDLADSIFDLHGVRLYSSNACCKEYTAQSTVGCYTLMSKKFLLFGYNFFLSFLCID